MQNFFKVTIDGVGEYVVPESKIVKIEQNPDEEVRQSIFHIRGGDGAASFTFVIQQSGAVLKVGWSCCSKNDNFSRKVGRELAEMRLKSKPLSVYFDPETSYNMSRVDIVRQAITQAVYGPHVEGMISNSNLRRWLLNFDRNYPVNG